MPTTDPIPEWALTEAREWMSNWIDHCLPGAECESCRQQTNAVARTLVAARDERDQQIVNYLQHVSEGFRLQRKYAIADAIIGIARKIHRGDSLE